MLKTKEALFATLILGLGFFGPALRAQTTQLKPSVTWSNILEHPAPLPVIGQLRPVTSSLERESYWSVGCETLDRDYSDFEKYKELVPLTGVGYARLQSGWAKTEQKKGVYDFTWIDRHVDGLLEGGVHPWICLCYGNPVYSDHGYDLNAGIFPDGEIMDAWLAYVKATVEHFKGRVTMYEIWNEPDNAGMQDSYDIYGNLCARTAQVIKQADPQVKVAAFGACSPSGEYIPRALRKILQMGQLDKIDFITYHGYWSVPEKLMASVKELQEKVSALAPHILLLQGETGCPGQLEYGHAMSGIEWNEYSQAKWDLRNMMIHFKMGIPYSVFTMVDLNYKWMMQSFGLVRMQLDAKPVYLRPKFHAVQHMTSLFQSNVTPDGSITLKGDSDIVYSGIKKDGLTVGLTLWKGWARPEGGLNRTLESIKVSGVEFQDPVYVDMLSGRVHRIPDDQIQRTGKDTFQFRGIPLWDSPVLIIDSQAVPFSPI